MILATAKDIYDSLFRRRNAYHTALDGDAGKIILRDLADFCGARKDLFGSNAREHAYHEGRRSVWLHIAAVLQHSTRDLEELSGLSQEESG